MKKCLALATAIVVAAALLTACDDVNTIGRASTPMVFTGAELSSLVGTSPGRIVAFAHERVDDQPTWQQIPVQIDERKVVAFGSQPSNNTTPGTTGTVYGSGSGGPTALQYVDPNTWVGADNDATFDADDELVFMVEDAGGRPRDGEETEPPGVVPGSGLRVQMDDPVGGDDQAWVYLFLSDTLSPGAGVDYVDYDFELTSGDYKTTYKRRDGPNPETSSVTTDAYEIEYPDRWFETSWRIMGGGATGVDILDGNKNQFALDYCGRSNLTFADEEGAFVANIDGPVRAIRSYVGANSGPLTQRTHVMYRNHEEIRTDLRVHAIPAVMDYIDYSDAALGMSYRSSIVPSGVTIDRLADAAVTTALPEWEYVTGAQGSVVTMVEYETDIPTPGGFDNALDWFYRDEANPAAEQCWGDAHHTGAHGSWVVQEIPNTDPRQAGYASLETVRTSYFAPPGVTNEIASLWATHMKTPLDVTVTSYAP